MVDVSKRMDFSVHLHASTLSRDVLMADSTMNMAGAEVDALPNANPVTFNFTGHVRYVFNKENGVNMES